MVIINSTPGVKKKYVDEKIANLKELLEAEIKASSTEITSADENASVVVTPTTDEETGAVSYTLGLKAVWDESDLDEDGNFTVPEESLANGTQYTVVLTVDKYGRVVDVSQEEIAPTVPHTSVGYWATTVTPGENEGDAPTFKSEWVTPIQVGEGGAVSILEGEEDKLITAGAVQAMVNKGIASVYVVKGSKTGAELKALTSTSDAPIEIGYVYNCSEDSVTDGVADGQFVLGANYVVTEVAGDGTLTWDKLSETLDLSGYATKSDVKTIVEDVINDTNAITSDIEDLYTKKEDVHISGSFVVSAVSVEDIGLDKDYQAGVTATFANIEVTGIPEEVTAGDVILTFSDRKIAYEAGLEVTAFDIETGKATVTADFPEELTEDVTVNYIILVGNISTHNAEHGHATGTNYNTSNPAEVETPTKGSESP